MSDEASRRVVETGPDPRPGTSTVLWVLWMTYGSFYFCRTNISAALPGIEAEFGFTKQDLGWVLASLKMAYAAGQLINGQLVERFSPRLLLAIGMFTSAVLNVLFGFGTAIYFWLFVWACNGYSQSLGWTPVMRVTANWIPVARRGVAIGILGTSYQTTAALTFVIAGTAADEFGWRAAFYVPAVLFALSGVHTLFFLREAPEEVRLARVAAREREPHSFGRNFYLTVTNRGLWLLALSLGLLNATRYGFLDWGLTHVLETQGGGLTKSALKYAVLPLGGIVGAFASGWATDRFFGGRRAPVVCGLLVLLGVLTLIYNSAVHGGTASVVVVLACVGFAIYGAQVLLVGSAPVDLARAGTPAAAVGFVNCVGYVGASASDVITGKLVDEHGWETAVTCWAAYAFIAAVLVALLWNARPRSS